MWVKNGSKRVYGTGEKDIYSDDKIDTKYERQCPWCMYPLMVEDTEHCPNCMQVLKKC